MQSYAKTTNPLTDKQILAKCPQWQQEWQIEDSVCKELARLVPLADTYKKGDNKYFSECFYNNDINACKEAQTLSKAVIRLADIFEIITTKNKDNPKFLEDPILSPYLFFEDKKCKDKQCAKLALLYAFASRNEEAITFAKRSPNPDEIFIMLGNIALKMNDNNKALHYLTLGCKRANQSCLYLGKLHFKEQNYPHAKKQFSTLCQKAKGEIKAQSCFYLGVMYYQGLGVERNQSSAKEYLATSCDLGFETACENLKTLE